MIFRKAIVIVMVLAMVFSVCLYGCASKEESTTQVTSTEKDSSSASATSTGSEEASDTNVLGVDEILIGFYGPLSGSSTQIGTASYEGALLATEQINAKGGILGVPIKLVAYDDKSSPEEAVTVVSKMIEIDEVHAIVGSLHSGNVLSSGQIVEDAKVPEIGIGTSPSWLQQGWTYLFRPLPNTSMCTSAVLAASKQLDFKTMVIFHSQDDFGKVGKDNMLNIAADAGIEVLAVESFANGDPDFTGQLTKLISYNADVFYIIAVGNELGPVLKQLRQLGCDGYTVGDNAFAGVEVKEIAGKYANKAIFVSPYTCPTAKDDIELMPALLKQFNLDYYERFGKLVESECAYRGYDSVNIIAKAITDCQSIDGPTLRDAIEAIHDFEGLAGTFDFRGNNGEGISTMRSYIIIDGKDVLLDDYLKTIG